MAIRDEFANARLGDQRLTRRLITLACQFETRPDASYPEAACGDAALEATYRFLNNTAVTPDAILEPHVEATCERARGSKRLVVAHDTTEFIFRRPGMGNLGEGRRGFLGHFALAVDLDAKRAPLGVVAMETIVRKETIGAHPSRRQGLDRHALKENEERRWWRGVEKAAVRVGATASPVHVMDREADSYELLAKLIAGGHRFVIRMHYNRTTVPDGARKITRRAAAQWPRVKQQLDRSASLARIEVPVSARKESKRTTSAHPARQTRTALLQYSATSVEIVRPTWTQLAGPPTLTVNVVEAKEVNPPAGDEPIEWRLITTEPVGTLEEVIAVFEAYRSRWTIEEYFRALKQGCAYEKRQLENTHALVNALAVFAPMAWHLLAMRTAARNEPNQAASDYLTAGMLKVLRNHPKLNLSAHPKARDVMLAVAQLGGHIRNNGDPGWIVLGRGYTRLLILEEGAQLARGCDQ